MPSVFQPRRVLLLSAVTLGLSAQAQTATAPASRPSATDETVLLDVFTVSSAGDKGYQSAQSISGTRFVTELKNAPFSVEVLPQAFLQEIKPTKYQDILNHSVGTIALTAFTDDNTTLYSRGFATALVLRDGVRRTGLFNPVSLERVEVLKGPTSVLFGITNPGGTVNVVSKKPTATAQSVFRQTIGRFDTSISEVDLGGPLSSDKKVLYRMPASYTTTDRHMRNAKKREFATAPVFAWQIAPLTKAEVSFDYVRTNGQPLGATPAIVDGPDAQRRFYPLPRGFSGVTSAHFENMSAALGSLVLQHGFDRHWTLRSNTAFFKRYFDTFIPVRGATQSLAVPAFPYFRDSQWRTWTDRNFQENLDLVGSFNTLGGKLTAIAGVEIRDDYNTFIFRAGTPPPNWQLPDPSTWNYNDTSVSQMVFNPAASTTTKFEALAYSLMAQLETLNDRLFVVGGVRHDTTETNFRRLSAGTTDRYEPKKTSFQLGTLFRFHPSFGVYANTATGFLPVAATLLDIDQRPFSAKPITSKSYEVGLKHELLGGRFQHSLAAYEITQENIVITLVVGAGTTTTYSYNAQSGEQRSRGFEYSFNAALTDRFAFFGGYARTDAKVTSDAQNPQTIGRTLGGSFKDKFNIYGRYAFSVDAQSKLSVSAGYAHYGPAPYGLSNAVYPLQTLDVGLASFIVDYSTKLGGSRWNFAVNVDNAFDQRYYSNLNYEGEPRNVRFSAEVRF